MTVAGLVPVISVPQFLPTVRALTETLDAAGYQLLLGQSGYDHSREEKLLNTMISRRPDGIVVTGLVHSPAAREQLQRLGIPVVETWDLSDRPVDMMVGFSHVKVGSAIAGFFLSRGWQRLGIATGDDHRAMMRCQGFLAAVGHEVPTAIVAAPSSLERGRRAMAELLEKDPHIEAVYCSSDGFAHGLMIEARSRGLRIPQDLAVCGFGDADFAAHIDPSLTTAHIDGAEIGRLRRATDHRPLRRQDDRATHHRRRLPHHRAAVHRAPRRSEPCPSFFQITHAMHNARPSSPLHHHARQRQRRDRGQRRRPARRHRLRLRPGAARTRAAGPQGGAGGPGPGQRRAALQRADRLRAEGHSGRQLGARAAAEDARRARTRQPADRHRQAAAVAAAGGLHLRRLPQPGRIGGHAQHPGHHADGAVRGRRHRLRGAAHQGRIAAEVSQRRRRGGAGTRLRLRRGDRCARRDRADPHPAQHQPEPEFRRRGDGGEPGLREAAAGAAVAAGQHSIGR